MPEGEEEENAFGNLGRIMQVMMMMMMMTMVMWMIMIVMMMQVFRIARIMRIFKLAKRSVGLQSIAFTVKTSYKDLGLLFSLVFLGALVFESLEYNSISGIIILFPVFGSLEFFLENEQEDTGFYSMIQGMFHTYPEQCLRQNKYPGR